MPPIPSESSFESQAIAALISQDLSTSVASIRSVLRLLLGGVVGQLPHRAQLVLKIALTHLDRLLRLVEVLEKHMDGYGTGTTLPLDDQPPFCRDFMRQRDIYCDRLTGLPNQTFLLNQIQQALTQSVIAARHSALLLINLDRFRVINDSLGYEIGDQLLIATAQRLGACLPVAHALAEPIGGRLARLQANEFAILLDAETLEVAKDTATTILKAFEAPFALVDHDIFVTVSIGIAWSQPGCNHPEDLLHDARTAMYRAKELGKDRYEIFDVDVRRQATTKLQLETELRLALKRQELQVHYQPIISLTTNTIAGFEALVRWNHPKQGMVSPTDFIPLAEETGLINWIGQWVLRQACQQLALWHQQFPSVPALTMSINLSARQFSQANLVEQVEQILQETGVDPHCIKLEITESAIMHNPKTANKTLQRLKLLGLQVYMDDFGTGYSSLAQLYQFPIDTLKIDRSFINRIDSEAEQLEIVQTIIKLAWNLGMNVVAEGVETTRQLSQLKALRCDYAQGYLFSQPLDSQASRELLRQSHWFGIK